MTETSVSEYTEFLNEGDFKGCCLFKNPPREFKYPKGLHGNKSSTWYLTCLKMLNTDTVGLVSSSIKFITGRFSSALSGEKKKGKCSPSFYWSSGTWSFITMFEWVYIQDPHCYMLHDTGFPLGTPTHYNIMLVSQIQQNTN